MLYMISTISWQENCPLVIKHDLDEAKSVVERVVSKQGVPGDIDGYCVTEFDSNNVAQKCWFYQCDDQEPIDNSWRNPGKAKWSWNAEPFKARPVEDFDWWRTFVDDSKIDTKNKGGLITCECGAKYEGVDDPRPNSSHIDRSGRARLCVYDNESSTIMRPQKDGKDVDCLYGCPCKKKAKRKETQCYFERESHSNQGSPQRFVVTCYVTWRG